MIKLALYDADGVLIHTELATIELERRYGVPQSLSQEFFTKEWNAILIGKEDTKEKMAPYLKKWGWHGSVEDYQKFWFEFEHKIDQKIIRHIQELRAKGIICAVATNQDRYRTAYLLENMGFGECFDAIFASAHLGKAKPDKEFFNLILQEYNYKPTEVVFWDDSAANVEAAKNIGITARIYKNFEDYKDTMDEIMGTAK
jgi:putative hydrolase of the HAD superfamily